MSLRRRELAWVVVLCLALAAASLPGVATGDNAPFAHDLATHHHPWRAWAATRWWAGQVPWWSSGAGFPLLAAGEGGLLYPPTLLLYMGLGDARALGWSQLLHAAWAGIGLHAYLRARGLRPASAAMGALSWTGSGWLAAHAVYPGMHAAVAWIAWGLLATERRNGPLLAVSVAMMGLAGHPQAAALGGLVIAGHLVLTAATRLDARASLGRGAVWMAVGVAVAAPQLLATWDVSHDGLRHGGLSPEASREGALPLPELVRLVLPDAFGWETPADVSRLHEHRGEAYWGLGASSWEDTSYLGIPVALLAGLGLAGGGRHARAWAMAAALGVLVALGGPAWSALRSLPGMAGFRFPVRALLATALATSVLAAHGVEQLRAPRRARLLRRVSLRAAAGLLVLAIVGRTALVVIDAPLRERLVTHLTRPRPELPPEPDPVVAASTPPSRHTDPAKAPARADAILEDLAQSLDPTGPRILGPSILAVLVALALSLPRRPRVAALGLLVTVDLARFSRRAIPLTPLAETRVAIVESRSARTAILDRRVATSLTTHLPAASLNLLTGTREVLVPTPLRYPRWEALVQAAGLGLWPTGPDAVTAFARGLPVARRLGVDTVRTVHDLSGVTGVHPAGSDGAVRVYRLDAPLPRARVVRAVEVATDAEVLERLPTTPATTVLLSAPRGNDAPWTSEVPATAATESLPDPADAAPPSEVRFIEDTDEQVLLEATGPGWLVLADPWAPGWVATVDGACTPLARADLAMRAVRLPAGAHRVLFRYDPGLPGLLLPWSVGLLIVLTGACAVSVRGTTASSAMSDAGSPRSPGTLPR